MTHGRRLRATLAAAALASLWLAGCKREEPPPAKNEMPVEQTPVSSLYEEQPGVLYEKAARTPTVSPIPGLAPTPSPTGRGKG
jgi:hypothetical protein